MLTLRQIEVVRAIMVTGTIAGAARLLNVSAPGLSRLMKHTEATLGVRLFDRQGGRYVPTAEARTVFNLLDGVYRKVEDLQNAVAALSSGEGREFAFASVPSIANVMVPRAVKRFCDLFPEIRIDINILKIEEVINYLLLGRGELVAISHRVEHPMLRFEPLAVGRLFCLVRSDHPLAGRRRVASCEIVRYPLIGIEPSDPYGAIIAGHFERQALDYDIRIKARFGTTVCSLVAAGLGIATIDEFTVAGAGIPGTVCLEIAEPTEFQTYVATRTDRPMSHFAERFVELLRTEMTMNRTVERQ